MKHQESCWLENWEAEKVEDFINIHFQEVHGNKNETEEFTLTDLPLMNPFD